MRMHLIMFVTLMAVAGACSDMRDDLQHSADLIGPVALADNLYYLVPEQETLVTVEAATARVRRSAIGDDAAAIIPMPDKQRAFVVHTARRALGILSDATGTEETLLTDLPQNFTGFHFNADASRAALLLNVPTHGWNTEQMLIDPLTAAMVKLDNEPSVTLFQLKERGDLPQSAVFSPTFLLAPENTSLPSDSADIFNRLVVTGAETLWIIDPDHPEKEQTALHLPLASPYGPTITFSANMDDGDTINDREYLFVHDPYLTDLFVITMTADNAGTLHFSINEIPVGRCWDTWFYMDDDRLKVLTVSSSGLKVVDVASSEATPVYGFVAMDTTGEGKQAAGASSLFIPMTRSADETVLLPTDNGLLVIELPGLERRGDRNISVVDSVTGYPFDVRRNDDNGFATLYFRMADSGGNTIKILNTALYAEGDAKALKGFYTAGRVCFPTLSASGSMLGMLDEGLCDGGPSDPYWEYYEGAYEREGRLLIFDPENPASVVKVTVRMSTGYLTGPILLNDGGTTPVYALVDTGDPAGHVILVNPADGSGSILDGFGLANLFD